MKKLKSEGNILDRLSELPDSVIHQILSFLEMRDVVRTTLLSKRWKGFWLTTPCLRFGEDGNDLIKLRNFVYRTLALWRGTHLREFSIRFSCNSEPESFSMDKALWVQFATERKVEDLCIQIYSAGLFSPPQCLYECSSFRKLSLYCCNLQIRGAVRWDCLNALRLSNCVISEDAMNQVFSSSPLLETFVVSWFQRFQNFGIRSSSLKKLWIHYLVHDDPYVLTIWAPNLEVLKYSGTPYIKILLTDVSSLAEVNLDFNPGSRLAPVRDTLCQILPVIRHVVTVELSASCFQVLGALRESYSFPPLLSVKLLTIDSWLIKLSDIVGLFECFPKLKKLVIHCKSVSEQFRIRCKSVIEQFKFDAENYAESEANILKSNMLQLRTVVITTWYVYEASFFEFTGFLLKHGSMIEKMVIRRDGVVSSDEMFEAAKKLMSLQRSFPRVELILC